MKEAHHWTSTNDSKTTFMKFFWQLKTGAVAPTQAGSMCRHLIIIDVIDHSISGTMCNSIFQSLTYMNCDPHNQPFDSIAICLSSPQILMVFSTDVSTFGLPQILKILVLYMYVHVLYIKIIWNVFICFELRKYRKYTDVTCLTGLTDA